MEITSNDFRARAACALRDADLQTALGNLKRGFQEKRARAVADLPEFEDLQSHAIAIKDHTLGLLDLYLERFEDEVVARGGHVHWCRDAAEARVTVLEICRAANARRVVKAKSMITEEIALNDYLEANGIEACETDLGEYIIQLRNEPPSHIIAPAIHLRREQVADTFRKHHRDFSEQRDLNAARNLVDEARQVMRERFLSADVGISGANLLIAETGSAVLVSNEGNIDLSRALPNTHIVIASIEKMVPTLTDAAVILRLLCRSATGQEATTYASFLTGPRAADEVDGPEAFHVLLLDNGRSELLKGEFESILRCIRCGACLNHCPVYGVTGGHAYGSVYTGPMGAVLTPLLEGLENAAPLPEASTFCGRCETVCPMGIPLVGLLRKLRERLWKRKSGRVMPRIFLGVWLFLARRPSLYHGLASFFLTMTALFGRRRGRLPFGPRAGGWGKRFPAPEGETFQALWRAREKGNE
ncbi:MAG: iron-sulfur cluster-binding protein [Rhodospirillaceae bacterium]|nr:MAG: iron-sulfur cluster-binding protein [Rhodospirillaceae bacterium]